MTTMLTCLLISVFVTILSATQFRCDYTYVNKANGWLKLHKVPANWHEARLRCHLEGTMLASPLNIALRSAMEDVMEADSVKCGVFTGIHATFSRGDFFSVEGIPLSKTACEWAEGEPDNYNDQESCTMLLPKGEMADVNCSDPLPYICYRKKKEGIMLTNNCGTVDYDYVYDRTTSSCYKFHTVPRTWSRAYMTCAAEGGYLAIINSDTEAQVLKELFAKYPGGSMRGNFWKDVAFVGFHDWDEHGEFLTIEGQTLEEAGYAKFSGGEPNNATTGEYCGAIYRSALLDDLWCENKYAFICEKNPTSLLCESDNQGQ